MYRRRPNGNFAATVDEDKSTTIAARLMTATPSWKPFIDEKSRLILPCTSKEGFFWVHVLPKQHTPTPASSLFMRGSSSCQINPFDLVALIYKANAAIQTRRGDRSHNVA